ncbi:MAG: PIN domain-containing protein [Methylibium sp.]|uniref:PIN domain-containing protein n=1 Tax=Methylibium sp. TaxID=2067992 RepID=UPI00180FC1CA|nr:PIN domain-containing protein [Methylibium sp.]MBA3599114.1 PIN domain-containing protein [Methylibium sp.]
MPLPTAVLDTNTVLDWLVFRDPATSLLAEQIESGALVWRTTPAMRREFEQVLPRACFAPWQPDAAAVAATWDRLASTDSEEPPRGLLLCGDPDDQVFIDLAIHRGCTWLISRDRALLRLARRAAAWRVSVLTPRSWHTLNAQLPTPKAPAQA